MKRNVTFLLFLLLYASSEYAQTVQIAVNAAADRTPISPLIYGRNNNLSDDPSSTVKPDWKRFRDAGLRFAREYGGNNGTKYNWRRKLSSHPDWYNNVYPHNWDYAAKTLQDSLPTAQGMWGFQLIGKAASTTAANFDDWNYNNSVWWSGVAQNLAGGGVVNSSGGSKAQKEGDPAQYLMDWNADSTTALLDHWFGAKGLGYDKKRFRYWTMDNEPEIWSGTHDDIMPAQLSAEAFMQLYFTVAKKARSLYPDIKLVGPVPASEWQWYSWNNSKITANGKSYVWLEYFIKRIAEEQAATGIRLLDVIDIHSYPNETKDEDILQLHRLYFDTAYVYPGANGVKTTSPSGWDNSINKEFIFERCNRWLTQYIGNNHGVGFAVSEYGFTNNNANVTAVSYASVLGTFANHQVEYFTPWYWYNGMWEVLHLYSRYFHNIHIKAVSTDEHYVSAYASTNTANDSMTIVLVNRSLNAVKSAEVKLSEFTVTNGNYEYKQLKQLPSSETFESHSKNALQAGTVNAINNLFPIDLPALSVTAILLKGKGSNTDIATAEKKEIRVYPNPVSHQDEVFVNIDDLQGNECKLEIYNTLGQQVYTDSYKNILSGTIHFSTKALPAGVYVVNIVSGVHKWNTRLIRQ